MGETASPGGEGCLDGPLIQTPKSFKLTLANHAAGPPWPDDLEMLDSRSEVQVSATMEVDAQTYGALAGDGEALFTVRQDLDLNPWHRKATGLRARARKLRHILAWESRRRVLRREVVEHISITVPNCRLQAEAIPSPQVSSNDA